MAALALAAVLALAAAGPKVAHKPDPAAASDVGVVTLAPGRNLCFEVVRAQLMASSRKSDRTRALFLQVILAESSAPAQITSARIGEGAPLRLVDLKTGDVACTEYQCPTGSSAVFALAPDAAAGQVIVENTAGERCTHRFALPDAALKALEGWADGLPKPKAG